ncbi:MAG: AAA family ATPase, partial [Elusimicrobia bacterium]|nr:AAA family ATPase [Elusimicrobiota bacterium]
MKRSHPGPAADFRPRWLSGSLGRAAADHPVVVLTGARQVGKATLLEKAEPTRHWKRVTFDDPETLGRGQRDPGSLWAGADRVVLAEVQRLPAVLSAVRKALDSHPGRMRFVLSASANLPLLCRFCERLGGRAAHLNLLPMATREILRRPPPDCLAEMLSGRFPREQRSGGSLDPFAAISRGFMPRLLALPTAAGRSRWWEGYDAAFLESELRDLSRQERPAGLRAVMRALARRAGQADGLARAARDCQLSRPALLRCLGLLETACLVDRLPPFAGGRSGREGRDPVPLWADPALAAHLAGLHDEASLKGAAQGAGLFANLVFHHL